MHSRLLSSGQLEDLLGTPSMTAFLQGLGTTPYANNLQEALVRYEGVRAVDEALARNLQQTTRRILEFADGNPRALIETILLRWDLANLRAIVRGKHVNRSADDVLQALLPAGTLSEVVLKEMAGQPDLGALGGTLDAVGHPLALAMSVGAAEYASSNDLTALELQLDRAYVERAMERASARSGDAAALRSLLQVEIDAANVKTAFRLASAGTLDADTRSRYFIPGGAILSGDTFVALSSADTQTQAWQRLRVSGFPVKELPTNLVDFERQLDLITAKSMADRYRGDPLGIDVVVGFLARKSAEVANLRLIARAKLLGLPRELVRREMLFV